MTRIILKQDSKGEATLVAVTESDEEKKERRLFLKEEEVRANEIAAAFRSQIR